MKKTFLATLVAFGLASGAQAASVNFADMTLNGSASLSGTNLDLTQAVNSQRGSAFTDAVTVDASTTFSVYFEFDIFSNGGISPGGADGLTFVVQNNAAGAGAIGGAGAGIGYQGMTNSIAVELDTWNNGAIDGGSANHVGINLNGDINSVERANAPFNLQTEGGPGHVWVEYDGTQLDVFINNSATQPGTSILSRDFDLTSLGSQVYFGFTSSTGAANAVHRIESFDLEVSAIPLPAGLPLLLGGVAAFALMRRKA